MQVIRLVTAAMNPIPMESEQGVARQSLWGRPPCLFNQFAGAAPPRIDLQQPRLPLTVHDQVHVEQSPQ